MYTQFSPPAASCAFSINMSTIYVPSIYLLKSWQMAVKNLVRLILKPHQATIDFTLLKLLFWTRMIIRVILGSMIINLLKKCDCSILALYSWNPLTWNSLYLFFPLGAENGIPQKVPHPTAVGALNFLRQLMQDALQKSTSRKTWEQPNGTVVQGPLSWKQLHHLATKGLFCLVAIFTVLIKAEA